MTLPWPKFSIGLWLLVGFFVLAAAVPPPSLSAPDAVIGNRDSSIAIHAAPTTPIDWPNLGRPVARVQGENDDGFECGTGFLISDDCLLTAAHVIRARGGFTAAQLQVEFDYEDRSASPDRHRGIRCSERTSSCSTPDTFRVASVTFLSPARLDCAVLKLRPKNDVLPGARYGHVRVLSANPVPGRKVAVVGHPDGGCKEWSADVDAKVVTRDDPDCQGAGRFSHGADTIEGSSGSAIFDYASGCVIGMHTGDFFRDSEAIKNCATSIAAIQAAMPASLSCTFDACDSPVSVTPMTWGRVKATYR